MKNEQRTQDGIVLSIQPGFVRVTLRNAVGCLHAPLTVDEARSLRDKLTRTIDAAERAPDDRAPDVQRVIDNERGQP